MKKLFALYVCAWSNAAFADLIINGNFSNGNTGFTTGYTYVTSDPPNQGGHYTVGTNPYNFNSGMGSFPDHTTGTGEMMILDGSLSSNVIVWQETIGVTPNTIYQWNAFGASAGQTNGNFVDPSPATLLFSANSVQVGTQMALFSQDDQWEEFTGMFNSGASSSEVLNIVDTNTTFLGNDFVLDDISLTPVPEPTSLAMISLLSGFVMLRVRRSTT